MSYKADDMSHAVIVEEASPAHLDWSQNQSESLFRRAIDTVLAATALVLFLFYPAVFLF